MIIFENFKVGNRILLLDLKVFKCLYFNDIYGFCLYLEFYGKDLGMIK